MDAQKEQGIMQMSKTLEQMDSILQKLIPENEIESGAAKLRIEEIKEYFKKIKHSDVMYLPKELTDEYTRQEINIAFNEVYATELQARSTSYIHYDGKYKIYTFGSLD